MARNTTRRVGPGKGQMRIERLELQEFARNLYRRLMDKGWTQSDLARAAFGTTTDARGYKVAKGRDRISVYLRGKAFPEPKTLARIAKALDCTPEELAPEAHASAIDREHPELAINVAAGHPDEVHLIVNKIVKSSVAAQVFALLADSDESSAH